MATADVKLKIIQLHNMKMDYGKIAIRTGKTVRYITKVIEEYQYEGTITVNSRLKNINYEDNT